MKTYILQELNEVHAARIDTLLHMLSPDAPALGHARLAELLADDSFWLFVTEDADGQLAGMLTLTRCHTLSRSKFWIEDVIVDPAYRGHGVGRALVHAAVEYVRTTGEHEHTTGENDSIIGESTTGCERRPSLYLTSNPKRTAARALYRSEGFEEYETGVFRIV
ncbi:MAG: GNAT family N-acetyltransferase [Bacteroidales bacterium]|nr:GNAT family N-acetyltransferase [Bacteroidales bacterium]